MEDVGRKHELLDLASGNLAGMFSDQCGKRVIAISNQTRARQGDSSFFHLFNKKPIRTVGISDAVYLLPKWTTDDDCVYLAGANDFEGLLCFPKPRTQFLDFSMRRVGSGRFAIRQALTVSHRASPSGRDVHEGQVQRA